MDKLQTEISRIKKSDPRWPDDYCTTMELATFLEEKYGDICIKTQKRFCCNYFYVLLKSGLKRFVVSKGNIAIFNQTNSELWDSDKDLFQATAKFSSTIRFKSRQEMFDKASDYVCS